MFPSVFSLVFGSAIAVALVVMLVTGRAPTYYGHRAERHGDRTSTILYRCIVFAFAVVASAMLFTGVASLM